MIQPDDNRGVVEASVRDRHLWKDLPCSLRFEFVSFPFLRMLISGKRLPQFATTHACKLEPVNRENA